MNFKRVNNITGWVVCLVACAVYIMTMEATGSLWDCGEFASSAYKLQIPHPPGAPLFVLIGRLFMAPLDPHHAVLGINFMSAIASGFTILFLFWTITHFARKIVFKDNAEETNEKIFAVMAAGVVGAMAYCFSDSFWYSAVESEVYAMSSFCTALVFWVMLKWEQNVDAEQQLGIKGNFTSADRWIILIFYLMGLSIGVHLLNLLTIPAIVMVYYYKRYKVTNMGAFWAILIGCVITGVVQIAVIQWTIKFAGKMDVLFVNSFGTPFFMGFAFFFILLAVLVFIGLRIANTKNWNFLKLGLWSFSFMTLGCFSSYFTTMVRSNADPSVDMYNVDNPVSLVGYLSRDQYGDWPILYGQDFTADVKRDETGYPDMKDNGPIYEKGKSKYEVAGERLGYQFNSEDMHIFPRMWDQSNDQGHADYYSNWAGIGKDKQGNWERPPTMGENIAFGISYQLNWMFIRYFMWNFAGKQNDIEGTNMGNVRDGNWKTGIGFLDSFRLGDQSTMPDSIKYNKSNNSLFALPLILGLLGLFYHAKKDKQNAWVIGVLFLIIGPGVIFYLNQAGNQPRERDYAFVGAFYAFAVWIGIGVLYVKDLFNKFIKNTATAGYVAAGICTLAVPVIMCNQEWDDHDRSHKVLARDLATDYLESCAPNAILITFGDNDTYPLWYAQEVEGIRKDIRVINSSLLGTDWYINQLRYKVNESAPTDVILSAEQIQGNKRDQVIFNQNSGLVNQPMDLYTMIKDYIGSDVKDKVLQNRDGSTLNAFPTKKVFIPVDVNFVRQNKTVNSTDSVVNQVAFEISKNYIFKNDLAILEIIAGNKWQRPIYFTSPDAGGVGFKNYIRQDGLAYRFVPVLTKENQGEAVNNEWSYDKMMTKFKSCNADVNGVYFDEENRRHLNSIRLAYAQAAGSLADNGRKEDAIKMLHKCDAMLGGVDRTTNNGKDTIYNFPYGMVSRGQQHNGISLQMLIASYKAGDLALADKISSSLKKDLDQQVAYMNQLEDSKKDALQYEMEGVKRLQTYLPQIENQFKNPKPQMIENSQQIKTQAVSPQLKTAADTTHKKK